MRISPKCKELSELTIGYCFKVSASRLTSPSIVTQWGNSGVYRKNIIENIVTSFQQQRQSLINDVFKPQKTDHMTDFNPCVLAALLHFQRFAAAGVKI